MRMLGTLLLLMLACFLLACGGTTTDAVYRTPIVERGVCATILMPGQTLPMPEPGETPGCQGGYTSIAGGGVVEEGQKTTKTEPHPVMKVIGAPFAVLLFPFKVVAAGAKKLGDAVSPDDEVPLDPRLRSKQAQVAKVDPQAQHEQEQLSALERQLEQRGGSTRMSQSGPAVEAGTASSAPAPARSSIAAELAALRGGAGEATSPQATVQTAALAPAARPAPSGATANPADRVLDQDGDGRVDVLSEYKGGQLARIRRDTDLDGAPDAWSFYRAGQLTREEQDPDGDGFRNRVALYRDGRLAIEREDRDGDGRVDRLTRYDTEERMAQRDEDQDGDGLVDARAYYEGGRLVRRELVSESQGDALEDEEDLSSAEWTAEPSEARP
jgi:hypothetical protein